MIGKSIKELLLEEKAKAYDEVLEKARTWYVDAQLDFKKSLEALFPELKESGVLQGGMIPKVECCEFAVRNGVARTHILDGRIPHSILIEVLSHKGIGTMVWRGEDNT